jgi:hypothetical protein
LKQFYLGIPLFTVDSIPEMLAVVAGVAILGLKWENIRKWFIKNTEKETKEITQDDKDLKRQQEIKLISRRVKEIYNDETKKNGMVIKEAYFGSDVVIKYLRNLSQQERMRTLTMDKYSEKVIDVTDSIRFYVDDSKLILTKKSKAGLYGFYAPNLNPDEKLVLYIR